MAPAEIEMNVKSDNSYKAGIELINKKFYTQSIHCLYYSVLQLMMYKLAMAKEHPLSYQEQEAKRILYRSSTHDWLYGEIRNRLSRRVRDSFQSDFHFLKQRRVEADYEKRLFSADDSLECRAVSERMRANMRYFK